MSAAGPAAELAGRRPVVLGGDCSVLIGALLGLRRLGRYGLCFLNDMPTFASPRPTPWAWHENGMRATKSKSG